MLLKSFVQTIQEWFDSQQEPCPKSFLDLFAIDCSELNGGLLDLEIMPDLILLTLRAGKDQRLYGLTLAPEDIYNLLHTQYLTTCRGYSVATHEFLQRVSTFRSK